MWASFPFGSLFLFLSLFLITKCSLSLFLHSPHFTNVFFSQWYTVKAEMLFFKTSVLKFQCRNSSFLLSYYLLPGLLPTRSLRSPSDSDRLRQTFSEFLYFEYRLLFSGFRHLQLINIIFQPSILEIKKPLLVHLRFKIY